MELWQLIETTLSSHFWTSFTVSEQRICRVSITICVVMSVMSWSNCSTPHPPRASLGTSLFFGCLGLITTYWPCPALYKHCNRSFFQVPCPFLSLTFFLWPRGCPGGGWGQNNLTGALVILICRKRWFIKMLKSIGPRIDLCCTSERISRMSLRVPFIFTNYCLWLR